MRLICSATTALLSMCVSAAALPAAELIPTSVSVGRNLQTGAAVRLTDPAPDGGLEIALTSGDPGRCLLSKAPDAAGQAAITVKVRPGFRESAEFWIQAVGHEGAATYTASAPGFAAATGTVTVAPSGIVLSGPVGAPKFHTTSRAIPTRLLIKTAMLDSAYGYVQEQAVAGGRSVEVKVSSSNPRVGSLGDASVTIAGPESTGVTLFLPAGPGETALAASAPSGFSAARGLAGVTAIVITPGLAVATEVAIGKNLQLGGTLSLGEPAPKDGVVVTLTSGNPELLLLSGNTKEVGSKSIEITIPGDGFTASYYLQALGDSGVVTYTASAPGYRTRTGTVTLTPSGVMITPAAYGPPDEGEILQPAVPEVPRKFVASLSTVPSVPLVVWTAQLDPATKRGADITVQPLRAGLRVNVSLSNSDPGVGTVDSTVVIEGGSEHVATHFVARRAGSAVISAATPAGFTTPSNATTVTAVVQP